MSEYSEKYFVVENGDFPERMFFDKEKAFAHSS